MTTTTETKKETSQTAGENTPFAVIETGGKQYMVSVGDTVLVELVADSKEGEKVTFDNVLVYDDGKTTTVGTPYISGKKVSGIHEGEKKGKKLSIIRFKAKSNRSRKLGHRQQYTQVRITDIA